MSEAGPASILSPEIHEAGVMPFTLVFRSGRSAEIQLFAPDYKAAQALSLQMAKTGCSWDCVRACLPNHNEVNPDKLEAGCAAQLEMTCFALTFGEEHVKKIRAAARQFMRSISAPKPPPVSETEPPSPKSRNGRFQNFASGFASFWRWRAPKDTARSA